MEIRKHKPKIQQDDDDDDDDDEISKNINKWECSYNGEKYKQSSGGLIMVASHKCLIVSKVFKFSSQEACEQWNWCTGLGEHCQIQWFGWNHLGMPSQPQQAPSTPEQSLCNQTWAASTWSSSVHHSILGTCGSHGTQTLSI